MSLKRDTPNSLFRTHFRLACRTLLLSPLGAPPPPERTRSPFNKIEYRLLVCPQNMASNDGGESRSGLVSDSEMRARATDTRRACLACIAEAPRATRALPLPPPQQQKSRRTRGFLKHEARALSLYPDILSAPQGRQKDSARPRRSPALGPSGPRVLELTLASHAREPLGSPALTKPSRRWVRRNVDGSP